MYQSCFLPRKVPSYSWSLPILHMWSVTCADKTRRTATISTLNQLTSMRLTATKFSACCCHVLLLYTYLPVIFFFYFFSPVQSSCDKSSPLTESCSDFLSVCFHHTLVMALLCKAVVVLFSNFTKVSRFIVTILTCYFRRGPGGKFVPPVLNRNAGDDDGWAIISSSRFNCLLFLMVCVLNCQSISCILYVSCKIQFVCLKTVNGEFVTGVCISYKVMYSVMYVIKTFWWVCLIPEVRRVNDTGFPHILAIPGYFLKFPWLRESWKMSLVLESPGNLTLGSWKF